MHKVCKIYMSLNNAHFKNSATKYTLSGSRAISNLSEDQILNLSGVLGLLFVLVIQMQGLIKSAELNYQKELKREV